MSYTEPKVSFEGIYEIPQAARYLLASKSGAELYKITPRHLIRWIQRGLALPSLAELPGKELTITFEDLISMRVIGALRAAGISWPKIKVAEAWLRKHTGTARPFATELLWTARSDIFAEFRTQLIAASRHGQIAMDIFQDYLIPVHGLTFGQDGIVIQWEPHNKILLQPIIQFGAPCIKGTRVPTRTVWGMAQAGDSIEHLARSFRITPEEIEAALSWEEAVAA